MVCRRYGIRARNVFFFSSRRRHTRCSRDWSSDVCSSDLFLNGELGPLESVDPHFTALLYAGDRYEAKPRLETALNNGQIVLADRYIASNLAHQTARVTPEKRAAFVEWIEHLEYRIYGLPPE